jgi:hypothetical protein
MASKAVGICLQDIDKKLFSYLYENKVALGEQINRDIYHYDRANSLNFRLRKLSGIGLIEIYRSPYLRTKNLFSLTTKGFKEFIAPESEIRTELRSSKVLHDIDLVDIRNHFNHIAQLKTYYTENLLLSGTTFLNQDSLMNFETMRPDAVVELSFPSATYFVAIEYEAALKYHARYRENLFKKYYGEKGVPAILYICKTPEILARVSAYERKFLTEDLGQEKAKFYYTTSDQLNQEKIIFENIQSKKLTLDKKTGISHSTHISLLQRRCSK